MENKRYYYGLEKVAGDLEMDLLQTNIPEFKHYIKRPVTYITFLEKYIGRLDLMAHKVYSNVDLWWVLALANDIDDPFDDTLLDTVMRVPDILDIYDFYDDNFVEGLD